MVATAEADPVRGTIDVSRLRPVDPSAAGTRAGKLAPDTLRQLDRALRTYFDLL
jgi:mRNA-degrading endonuclease toxin of MazEF toxin-antitoxin module